MAFDKPIRLPLMLQALKREGVPSATDRAVRLATAQADVEITRLKSACSDLEQRALSELNEMHDELLDMREACYKLEIALEDSESKRCGPPITANATSKMPMFAHYGSFSTMSSHLAVSVRCPWPTRLLSIVRSADVAT